MRTAYVRARRPIISGGADALGSGMQVLVVQSSDGSLPGGAFDLIERGGWEKSIAHDFETALDMAKDHPPDTIILTEPTGTAMDSTEYVAYRALLQLIEARRLVAMILSDETEPDEDPSDRPSMVERIPIDISPEELHGRLTTIDRYHGHFQRLEREVRNMELLSKRLNDHFREVDQEMRLAARLQRDFLPRLTEPIQNIRFATLFRPASWVSGDLFDVFRIDEQHTGFYLADAVGHGMAASLLTMFIKRSVSPKRVDADGETMLSPSEVLSHLNNAIVEQELPNCQFVTAWYGLFNHQSGRLTYARGGHPYPILIRGNDPVSELKSPGGLLGLTRDEHFQEAEIHLEVGDKLLVYTDGVELAFQAEASETLDTAAYMQTFKRHAHLPIQDMLARFEAELDRDSGSLKPHDDITMVGLEVLP